MRSERRAAFARRPVHLAACAALAALAGLPAGVQALPAGAQVTQGSATLQQQGGTLTVTTSNGAVIHWQRFGIAAGETARFVQPSADSQVLNRVVGGEPSVILGNLMSNGRVFLINPSGVAFGRGAQVDVGALVVSTLRLSDTDFTAGRLDFGSDGRGAVAGAIRQAGSIRTASGGSVYLVAPQVDNSGIIHTPEGEVLLAAGHRVTLVNPRAPEVSWEVAAPPAQALNLGEVVARRISLIGAEVGNAGTLRATTAVRGEDGSIVLRAARSVEQGAAGSMRASAVAADGSARGGAVQVQAAEQVKLSGTVDVRPGALEPAAGAPEGGGPAGSGGRVDVFARDIALQDGLMLDASGPAGGGQVRVGGGLQGQWAGADNARTLRMAPGATIRADATDAGPGGNVILWADGSTAAHGAISARGGPRAGDGGFIETSGRLLLDVSRAADASAPAGRPGQWLLDPADIEIVGRGGSLDGFGQPYTPPDGTLGSTLSASVITAALNQGTDVRVSTGAASGQGGQNPIGRITVSAPIVMNAASATTRASLHLQAATSIFVNDDIRADLGILDLRLEPNFGAGTGASGSVTLSGATIDLRGGRLEFVGTDPVPVSLFRANGAQTLANLSMAGKFDARQLGDLTLRDVTLESGTFTVTGAVSAEGRLAVGSATAPDASPRLVVAEGEVRLDTPASRLEVAANGELNLVQGAVTAADPQQGGSVFNAGAVVFSDASGGQGQQPPPSIQVPLTNDMGARLEVTQGTALLTAGLVQDGTVSIGRNATLLHVGRLTNRGTLRSQGTLDLEGGTLVNVGRILLEPPAVVSVPNPFTVRGSLELTGDGRIEAIVPAGSVPQVQSLSVTGLTLLGGRVDLNTDPATFRPFNGQTFDLITSGLPMLGVLGVPLDFKGAVLPGLDGKPSIYRLTYLGPTCPVGVCWTGFAQNGDWTDGRNWSTRSRPPVAGESAFIRQASGASVVLASTAQAVGSLETDPGNDLSLTGGSLTVSGTTTLGGTLSLADAGSTLVLNGPLRGSGSVLVTDGRLTLADTASLAVARLQQSGGTVGFGGAFGRSALAGRFSRSGGTVDIQGTYDNAGSTLDIGATGVFGSGAVVLSGTLDGGTLVSSDTTALEGSGGTLKGVTLAGTLATSGRLVVTGGLRLADAAVVDGGSTSWSFEADTALSTVSGTATLRGRDTSIEVARGGAGALDIGAGITLDGTFQVEGASGSVLRNAGTFEANGRGSPFSVRVDRFENTGTLRTGRGNFEVDLLAGPFTNDGTVDLAGETELLAAGGVVNNGTLRGDGRISLQGATLRNRGILQPGGPGLPGNFSVDGNVVLESGSTFEVLIDEFAGASRLTVFGNVELGGVLKARLAGGFQPPADAAYDLVSASLGSTMQGAFNPNGSILPTGFNGAIVPGSLNTSFLYRLANSGQSCPGVCWTGGAGDADWSKGRNWTSLTAPPTARDAAYINLVPGAQVTVSEGTHVVASLDTTVGNDLTISGGSLTVLGPARLGGALGLAGGTLTLGNGSTLALLRMSGGRLAGEGEVTLAKGSHTWSGGTWAGTGSTRLAAGGALEIGGGAGLPTLGGRTLAVDAGATATVSSDLLLEADSSLRNAGTLVLAAGRVGAALQAATPSTLQLENTGALEKTGAGEATLVNASLSGGGTLSVLGGRLVHEGGSGTVGGALAVAAGATWEMAGGTLGLQGPVSNAQGAALRVTAGATLDASAASAFEQRGELTIGAGSTLRRTTGLENAATGVIGGAGTLDLAQATLTNAGTLRPGGQGAVGTLTVQGGVVLGASSVLEADLQAAGSAASADRLAVSGPLALGGALVTAGAASLTPQQQVDLLSSATALTGQFARTQLPAGAFGRIDALGGLKIYRLAGCAGLCWDGGAGTLAWGDAANWSSDRVPGAADAVSIDMAAGVTVALGTASRQAASLALAAGSGLRIDAGALALAGGLAGGGTLTLSGGSLALGDTAALTLSRLVQTGGTLELGGRFGAQSISGRLARSAGEVVLAGTLLNTGAVLDIGRAGIFGAGGLSRLSGTVAGGTLLSTDGTVLVTAGGTLDGVTVQGNLAQTGALNLAGVTVLASAAQAPASVFDLGAGSWSFQPGATLAVQGAGATIRLAGGEITGRAGGQQGGDLARPLGFVRPAGPPGTTPFVLPAGLTVSGSGTLSFAGGVLNQGTLRPGAAGLRVGTAAAPSDLGNEGLIDLSYGPLAVSGNLDLAAASRLELALDGTRFGVGAPGLTVAGSARLAGGLAVDLAPGFAPAQGARFDLVRAATVASDTLTGSAGLRLPPATLLSVLDGTTLRLSVPVAGEQTPVQSTLAGATPSVNLAVLLSAMALPVPPLYAWALPDPCLDEEGRGLRVSAPVSALLRDPVRDRAPTESNLAQDDRARLAPRQEAGAGPTVQPSLLRRSVSSLALPGAASGAGAPVSLDLRRGAGLPAGTP